MREGFSRTLKDEQNIPGQRKEMSNPRRGTRGRKAKSGERIMIRPEFLVYLETGSFQSNQMRHWNFPGVGIIV